MRSGANVGLPARSVRARRWPGAAAKRATSMNHRKGRRAQGAISVPRVQPARERTVVLLGHEITGVPEEHVDAADLCVEIPMVGIGASLNVAVAGSLVLYRLAGLV